LLICIFMLFGCEPSNTTIDVSHYDPSFAEINCSQTISTDSLLILAEEFKIKYFNDKEKSTLNFDSLHALLKNDKKLQYVFTKQIHNITAQYEKQKIINEKLKKPSYRRKDSIIYKYVYKDSIIYKFDTIRKTDTIISFVKFKKKKRKNN